MLLLAAALVLEPELTAVRRDAGEATAAVSAMQSVPVEPARVPELKAALDRLVAVHQAAVSDVRALDAKLVPPDVQPTKLEARFDAARLAAADLERRRVAVLKAALEKPKDEDWKKLAEDCERAQEDVRRVGELRALEEARWDARHEAGHARPQPDASGLAARGAALLETVAAAKGWLDKLDVEPRSEHRTRVYERFSELKDHGQAVFLAADAAASRAVSFAARRRAAEKALADFEREDKAAKERLEDGEKLVAALEKRLSELLSAAKSPKPAPSR